MVNRGSKFPFQIIRAGAIKYWKTTEQFELNHWRLRFPLSESIVSYWQQKWIFRREAQMNDYIILLAKLTQQHISCQWPHREDQRPFQILRFCSIFLLISGLFIQNSFALTSYTWQERLDIGLHHSDSFITSLRLIPEISRTPGILTLPCQAEVLAGSVMTIKRAKS